MLSIQKDAALRGGEVLRLCEDDISWGRKMDGGTIPIVIRESKGRAAGCEETVALTGWAVERLKRYLEIRARVIANKNITPGMILSAKTGKSLGQALFFTHKGRPLEMASYQLIFKAACDKAGLDPRYRPTTCVIRISASG